MVIPRLVWIVPKEALCDKFMLADLPLGGYFLIRD
jgi:hypothetical protein